MTVYSLEDLTPEIHETAFISPGAHVIGQTKLGEQASVWFGTTIRGDNAPIEVGARSNIQENSVLHVDPGNAIVIGDDVTVGHQAMLHGCTIGDGSLIGIQAVVLNGAKIGKGCLVGAGSLVTEGKEFPDNVLILGSPAKVARELTEKDVERLKMSAASYVARAAQYREHLTALDNG
jgi:carbonic anhydrase/acetyltransferase-like protein (isoleucine patch superfamily)